MKILILPDYIMHYRIELYNAIHKHKGIELTVGYSEIKGDINKCKFNLLHLPKSKILNVQSKLIHEYHKFDKIIALFDFHFPIYFVLSGLKKKHLIWWGIGKGNNQTVNLLRLILVKYLPSPLIVYMDKVKTWYEENGVSSNKLHVMGNTIHVNTPMIYNNLEDKKDFLLLGSINSRKRYEDFFEAFARVHHKMSTKMGIKVIGDGGEKDRLISLIQRLKLQNRVNFIGFTTDQEKIQQEFSSVLATVSPGQAGLTVLHSFAHGVPMVTYENAISGGEIENIFHGKNGLFTKPSIESLSDTLLLLANNKNYAFELGQNALKHYTNNRTLKKTVQSFVDFIIHN
ncbi:MAG: glycosyltransferase family 4 protein [Chitinophagales bacterium]|nr:glycosyltransferase family 4 protein [Chitinophagales bacterium]